MLITSATGCSGTSSCWRKDSPRPSAGSPRATGMGLTRDDVLRQGLPLPPADYLAETGEEALVMYADKFHSKTTPPALLTACAYAASVRRFGEDKVARFEWMRAAFGEPDLGPFTSAYGHPVIDCALPAGIVGQARRYSPQMTHDHPNGRKTGGRSGTEGAFPPRRSARSPI